MGQDRNRLEHESDRSAECEIRISQIMIMKLKFENWIYEFVIYIF